MSKTVTRLLVCGGRDYSDSDTAFRFLDWLREAVEDLHRPISIVIHGAQTGADQLADDWARERGIPRDPFPAQWTLYGLSAGPRRNAQMLREGRPDMCVAFPGGDGTADMVARCERAGVVVLKFQRAKEGPQS